MNNSASTGGNETSRRCQSERSLDRKAAVDRRRWRLIGCSHDNVLKGSVEATVELLVSRSTPVLSKNDRTCSRESKISAAPISVPVAFQLDTVALEPPTFSGENQIIVVPLVIVATRVLPEVYMNTNLTLVTSPNINQAGPMTFLIGTKVSHCHIPLDDKRSTRRNDRINVQRLIPCVGAVSIVFRSRGKLTV